MKRPHFKSIGHLICVLVFSGFAIVCFIGGFQNTMHFFNSVMCAALAAALYTDYLPLNLNKDMLTLKTFQQASQLEKELRKIQQELLIAKQDLKNVKQSRDYWVKKHDEVSQKFDALKESIKSVIILVD